ncbi:MAG: hypothetical protein WA485_14425 [Candidatus Sulfotelmatobacter sp.]
MRWYSVAADVIFFSPGGLLSLGWTRWIRADTPRDRRSYVVAAGLIAASISCACLFGVVLYLQVRHIGYWNEYRLASGWGRLNWPLSVLAVLAAILGKGRSRVLLLCAGCALVTVWTIAFIH